MRMIMSEDSKIINDRGLDVLFREARTYNNWLEKDVSDVLIQAVYDLMKWGPTSANCCPARFVFVRTNEAKARLSPHLAQGNVDKSMAAPVTAIIANDLEFFEKMDFLFPHTDAASWFRGKPATIHNTAMRNATLQGAYFMLAARSLGLDCGPMSGFDPDGVKDEFFADENVEVNFLCNLGYGDPESLFDRSPRFPFDDVCKII